MLFNSLTFVFFFAAACTIYYCIPDWRGRKIWLLANSYLFYAAWNPPFVLLLWLSTIVDWFLAKRIYTTNKPNLRRLFLLGSLSVNLGLLAFFKYGSFALENLQIVLTTMGIHFQPVDLGIALPVGISFYTFQTLSYTLDIYNRKSKPWTSFLDYALYVTFFPQLVAGPIVRATDFLEQCKIPNRFSADNLGLGLTLMTIGLFQKIVIADALLAPVAEKLYGVEVLPNTISAWVGTLAFTGQIFCDFAGYSTCAIGVALCLGFVLPDNFNFPYAAIGFSDFWRRWHISLSSWLRDYLYIPLGGNRLGSSRTQINLMITMLLGGLWHGAAWTFVVWGGLHGFYLMAERFLRSTIGGWAVWERSILQLSLGILTFILTCVSWVFFRADSLSHAWVIIKALFNLNTYRIPNIYSTTEIGTTLILVGSMLTIHWLMREREFNNLLMKPKFKLLLPATLASMLYLIVTTPTTSSAFIYFQF